MDIDVMQRQLSTLMQFMQTHEPALKALADGENTPPQSSAGAASLTDTDADEFRTALAGLSERVGNLETSVSGILDMLASPGQAAALAPEHEETLNRVHSIIGDIEKLIEKFPFLHGNVPPADETQDTLAGSQA